MHAALWSPQIAAFESAYDIIVPDLRTLDTLDARARAALDGAGDRRLSVAGHALGARIALDMVHLAPEQIERLALVSASIAPVTAQEAEKRREGIELARKLGMTDFAQRWCAQMLLPDRRDDAAFVEQCANMIGRFSVDDYALEQAMILKRLDQAPILAAIARPTLVLAGARDPLSSEERNRQIAARIANAELRFIAAGSHLPMLDAPEETTKALRCWLTDV